MPHGGQGPEWHLMVLVSLVLFAVVINALDPSYQAFYTTFSHLVTLQSVSIALLWTWKHHDNQAWLGTACQALSFVIFALSVQTTVQTGRDVGHCLENTATDREDAHNCIDLYASYAALDGPHGVQNACATNYWGGTFGFAGRLGHISPHREWSPGLLFQKRIS